MKMWLYICLALDNLDRQLVRDKMHPTHLFVLAFYPDMNRARTECLFILKSASHIVLYFCKHFHCERTRVLRRLPYLPSVSTRIEPEPGTGLA